MLVGLLVVGRRLGMFEGMGEGFAVLGSTVGASGAKNNIEHLKMIYCRLRSGQGRAAPYSSHPVRVVTHVFSSLSHMV